MCRSFVVVLETQNDACVPSVVNIQYTDFIKRNHALSAQLQASYCADLIPAMR
jgi:hypothetical protein